MTIYIGAPFFTPKQLKLVQDIENVLKRNRILYYSPRSEGVLINLTEKERAKEKQRIYKTNIDNIDDCSMMIAVIDDRDIGTIWEMGYATSAGKPIISLSNQDYGLNVMLAESVQAHVKNLEEMLLAIYDPSYKGHLQTGVC